MARWADFEAEAPELAALARAYLDGGVHKTIATLRADGSPRISGTECYLTDGELWWGSMGGARKARDLQRDPRFALHSASKDPDEWTGDAKVAGRAVELDAAGRARLFAAIGTEAAPGDSHAFRAELTEVVVTMLSEDRKHLVIELWRPGQPVRTMSR